jgi:hypothetical protein
MDSASKCLDDVRLALRSLAATGATGFEGFVAVILTAISGHPFRLASSGTQRGRDGNSAFDEGATYFEAKLYEDEVPKKDVTVKLADLANDDRGQVDLWVLGSTAATSAQHAKDYELLAAQHGIGILLLDWTGEFPALALAAQLAGAQAANFLKANLVGSDEAGLADTAIDAMTNLAAQPGWAASAAALRRSLSDASVGLGLAKAANNSWLRSLFSNRKRSHVEFGQCLAPLASASYPLQRRSQVKALAAAFAGPCIHDFHAVIGGEGAGKSWLAVQTWLESKPQCLLIVSTADEYSDDVQNDIEGFLIKKLAHQTRCAHTEAFRTRWQRRFRGWRENPDPENVRVALLIDGLNQAPHINWRRRLDSLATRLRELGGQLIITTRANHFARFRNALANIANRVLVPDWTESELTALLVDRGVQADTLSADVFGTLRNPRILSMALELLDAKDIERIEEFSVGRLLFEHMRRSDYANSVAIPAYEFARALREVAAEFIDRLTSQGQDDLKLFSADANATLAAVSSSRYFAPVGDDPDLYSIRDDGLHLALGLWLVSVLEKEERNHHDPRAKVVDILDPIMALDQSAEIVASAVQAACLGETCPTTVRAALIEHFVGLQNLPANGFDAFAALAGKAPEAFVLAGEWVALSRAHVAGAEWIEEALLRWRDEPVVAAAIKKKISEWLSLYSLAPERMMFKDAGRDPVEQVQEERARRQAYIDAHMAELTAAERTVLDQLVEAQEPHFSDLHRLAFALMAGKPLAEFARPLMHWAFSDVLAPSHDAMREEFEYLVRFNRADWAATRDALLGASEWLEAEAARSKVGAWALVHILRSTGAPEDAGKAETLADWLTRDRERYGSWRRVEGYCATDPCDPNSSYPDNIDATASRLADINVSELSTHMGRSLDDHFWTDATPGVARFKPEAGVEVLRRLARDILTRDGFARRQGVLAILPHAAAVDEPTGQNFLIAGQNSDSAPRGNETERDAWITAQYSLSIALPHLSGDEQLDAIAGCRGNMLLLQMMETLKPASEETAQKWLEIAAASADTDLQTRVLAALHYSRTRLMPASYALVGGFLGSPEHMVHTQTLGIISRGLDLLQLQRFIETGWTARALSLRKQWFELWYGSRALITGVKYGLLGVDDAVKRLRVSHFGFAAIELGAGAGRLVADLIDEAIARVFAYQGSGDLPEIEAPTPTGADSTPPMVSLDERVEKPRDIRAALDLMNESAAEYSARQKRAGKAFSRFTADLESAEADLALEDLTADGVAAIVAAAPEKAREWVQLLASASDAGFQNLYHFAYQLAQALAQSDTDAAETIFRRLRTTQPTITRVVGAAKVPAELLSLWSCASLDELKLHCFERLDTASNDAELAIEVLAALKSGAEAAVADYVRDRLCTAEPAMTCRALMVCGYAEENEYLASVLALHADAKGFVGTAARAAREAYERNIWSKHWYRLMRTAANEVEFWRYSVLLGKIVDGRFSVWASDAGNRGAVFVRFMPTVKANLERRIAKWTDKRKKQLFGGKVPDQMFLK